MTIRKALVTGASEGIGRAFAEALAREGYAVTAVARNEALLGEVVRGLGGTEHRLLVADLADATGVQRVCADITAQRYALLVNNAGIGTGGFVDTPLDRLQHMTRLNCDAVVALSHAYLRTAGEGDALLNVASALALLGFPPGPLYAATKAFVLSLSESLWYTERERGIYVMGLCPGATRTRFHETAGGDPARRPPENMTQLPEEVVAEALSALRKRSRPTVVTGSRNRAVATATRLMSSRRRIEMMGKLTRGRR